ncbi:MAG: 16S rRNA (guanine(527)-N(7))-methyltransferase RsmG [Bacteroidia bacterium]|nr:16S rRNA (guanine(527)-N(7))-methyltransferase RsmG [Bacteroidia bacterium]MDW8235010.1 16S rRNA (guanine(527)-N(7))-methyltransferase RsmG [Bacteroidia bacterium]
MHNLLPPPLAARLSPAQIAALQEYARLLTEINTQVNLISRKDIAAVWSHHILPSLLLLCWYELPAGAKVLDIGTGGGLPGIPLAIAQSHASFLLIDSTRKKIEAVRRMTQSLGLEQRVQAEWIRAEELQGQFPVIVGRAVAPLSRVLGWAKPLLAKGGVVYYYTGEPLPEVPKGWRATFLAFREVCSGEAYLSSKGILCLRR